MTSRGSFHLIFENQTLVRQIRKIRQTPENWYLSCPLLEPLYIRYIINCSTKILGDKGGGGVQVASLDFTKIRFSLFVKKAPLLAFSLENKTKLTEILAKQSLSF